MGEQLDRSASMRELCRGARECKKGTSWKDGPLEYYLKRVAKCEQLRESIRSGRYKITPGAKVEIYRPKRRTANAPRIQDRTFQRSMCNNGVYEDLTRSLIFDNMACQKGKGTDLAIRRVIRMLQRLHKKALAEERKTLRGLKRGVDQGARTMEDVKRHYQSWIANAEYAGDAPIRAMDHFYTVTFRRRPEYKRKRRHLYGNRKKRKGTDPGAGARERAAEERAGGSQGDD